METLQQVEHLCERMYNTQDPSERSQAESMLRVFSENPDYIQQCQTILDQSQSPYAQLMVASSLTQLITNASVITSQMRLDIRNYVLNYLATHAASLADFSTTALVTLLCRVTKLGWFENEELRGIVKDTKQFLNQQALGHVYLGMKILNQLVTEMNQQNGIRSLTQHRKAAVSFRDVALGEIFEITIEWLKKIRSERENGMNGQHVQQPSLVNTISANGMIGEEGQKVQEETISLALRCLSFDFVGTSLDESTEDLGTIQVPSSWRLLIEEKDTMQIFFDVYWKTEPMTSNMALECLVKFASIRRSLFATEKVRLSFLGGLMKGTLDILSSQTGLTHHNNYHEFCRLLGRFKSNYQLGELVGTDCYLEWINHVAEFTYRSLQSWQWTAGSVYYLLGLWSRLVASSPYLKSELSADLEKFVPKIVEVYLTSRLESVSAIVNQTLSDDPLDNQEHLQDQLDSLPQLFRFQYEKSVQYLNSIMDPLIQQLSAISAQSAITNDAKEIMLVEGRLTWAISIVGAIIRGRLSSSSSSSAEPNEILDGLLCSRAFKLMEIMDTGPNNVNRYNHHFRQRLDIALLTFFQSFRRAYIGEQSIHASKVYVKLNELLGLQDHVMILNVVVRKIAVNLQVYAQCGEVVEPTLTLFHDLATGYMSGKLLLKLDHIKHLLQNHSSHDNFPFLKEAENFKSRTLFYATLGRMIFTDVGSMQVDIEKNFRMFMVPLAHSADFLIAQAKMGQLRHSVGGSASPRELLIGLLRDLRGIAVSTCSRRTYGMLFEWFHPRRSPVLSAAIENFCEDPNVTTPLLKFMAEFVLNKSQRLTFDSSSPNGILLFREVSRLICGYGARILAMQTVSDVYTYKYKGIAVSITMLTRALAGNYVNFGVFDLYGDPVLTDALDIAMKLCLSIPQTDILAYRKLSKAYFAFIEVLCQNHVSMIIKLDTMTFVHVVQSMQMGLRSHDVSISSQCAASIDNIATFHYQASFLEDMTESMTVGEETEQQRKTKIAARHLRSHFESAADLFPKILRTLFEIVLFEDCSNQWSLSRPMLSLILMNEKIFPDLKAALGSTLSSERKLRLENGFAKLMEDVTRSLEAKNRDRFVQNLTLFRHEFKTKK